MKAIRWLLCHLLAITLVVSIVLIYSFRDALQRDFDSLMGNTESLSGSGPAPGEAEKVQSPAAAGVKQPGDETTAKARNLKTAAKQPPLDTTPARENPWKVEDAGSPGSPDPWNRVLPDTPVAEQQNAAPGSSDNRFPPDNYDPETSGNTPAVEGAGDHPAGGYPGGGAVQPAQQASNEPVIKPDNQAAETIPGNGSTKNTQYLSILSEARKLYWDGNAGQARSVYEKLMFDFPEQPEAPAELGNLLLQSGNRKAAVWAYQNAIQRYLNLHRNKEAITLMRSISQIDPAIAESLQKKYW